MAFFTDIGEEILFMSKETPEDDRTNSLLWGSPAKESLTTTEDKNLALTSRVSPPSEADTDCSDENNETKPKESMHDQIFTQQRKTSPPNPINPQLPFLTPFLPQERSFRPIQFTNPSHNISSGYSGSERSRSFDDNRTSNIILQQFQRQSNISSTALSTTNLVSPSDLSRSTVNYQATNKVRFYN